MIAMFLCSMFTTYFIFDYLYFCYETVQVLFVCTNNNDIRSKIIDMKYFIFRSFLFKDLILYILFDKKKVNTIQRKGYRPNIDDSLVE